MSSCRQTLKDIAAQIDVRSFMLEPCKQSNAPDLLQIRRLEKLLTGVGFALWFLLRAVCVWVQPWDSDEPQHLHVVWSWTEGLIPYRDFFDNHTPLFHVLCAPFLMAFGVRPDIIVWMRWLIVQLNAFILWIIYRIGKNVFSTRGGLLAAFLVLETVFARCLPLMPPCQT